MANFLEMGMIVWEKVVIWCTSRSGYLIQILIIIDDDDYDDKNNNNNNNKLARHEAWCLHIVPLHLPDLLDRPMHI